MCFKNDSQAEGATPREDAPTAIGKQVDIAPADSRTTPITHTYKYDIGGLLSMHARTLNLVDLLDQAIQSIRDLLRRPVYPNSAYFEDTSKARSNIIPVLTAIPPDIPWHLSIQFLLLPPRANLLR